VRRLKTWTLAKDLSAETFRDVWSTDVHGKHRDFGQPTRQDVLGVHESLVLRSHLDVLNHLHQCRDDVPYTPVWTERVLHGELFEAKHAIYVEPSEDGG
jgi:hypothetical protein